MRNGFARLGRARALPLTAGLALLAALGVARADTVYLKDGRVLEGEVSETVNGYVLEMKLGRLELKRSDVLRIEEGPAPKERDEGEGEREPEPERTRDAGADGRAAAEQAGRCRVAADGLLAATQQLYQAFDRFAADRDLAPAVRAANTMRSAARDAVDEIDGMKRWARRFDWATREAPEEQLAAARSSLVRVVTTLWEATERLDLADKAAADASGIADRAFTALEELKERDRDQERWMRELSRTRLQCNRVIRSLDRARDSLRETAGSLARVLEALGIDPSLATPPSTEGAPGGTPAAPGAQGTSVGSGFFVDATHIVTNAHVVREARTARVEAANGAQEGLVVARDTALDLALVVVPNPGPGALKLGVDAAQPGVLAFAYGYGVLAGETSTLLVTRGTVSATQPEHSRLVFDGRVNPGNSGGPLVDVGGRWIGVVVAKSLASQEQAVDSFGFAIDGRVAASWLEQQKVTVSRAGGLAEGLAPPDADVRRAVVRLVVTP